MAERMQLNEQDLESVVGGAFHYNSYENPDGSEYMTCRVDGASTYYCTENAKNKISAYIILQRPTSLQQVIDYAITKGYFTEMNQSS
jgi:hypothetical protein